MVLALYFSEITYFVIMLIVMFFNKMEVIILPCTDIMFCLSCSNQELINQT